MRLTEEAIEKMRVLFETTGLQNSLIAKDCGCATSTVSRLSIELGWQRPEGYIRPRGGTYQPPELILNHARTLYDQGVPIHKIAKRVNRSAQTVAVWRAKYGWVREKKAAPKPEPKDNGWPKVTAEWPATERFDTAERHRHDLDEIFLPIFREFRKADTWATM